MSNRGAVNRRAVNASMGGQAAVLASASASVASLTITSLTTSILLASAIASPGATCPSASLTTSIRPAAAAVATASCPSASLTTQISAAATAAAAASATPALTTGIPLVAAPVAGATLTPPVLKIGVGFAATPTGGASCPSAALTTGIPLAATAAANVTATMALGVYLSASAQSSSSMTLDLYTLVLLWPSPAISTATATFQPFISTRPIESIQTNSSVVGAALSTQIKLGSSAIATSTLWFPSLDVPKPLVASAQSATGSSSFGTLTTESLVHADLTSSSACHALLGEVWTVHHPASSSATAHLTTGIKLASAVASTPVVVALLDTYQPIASAMACDATLVSPVLNTQAHLESAAVASFVTVRAILDTATPINAFPKSGAVCVANATTQIYLPVFARIYPTLTADLSITRVLDVPQVALSVHPGKVTVGSPISVDSTYLGSALRVPLFDSMESHFGNVNNWVEHAPATQRGLYIFDPTPSDFDVGTSMPITYISGDDGLDGPTSYKKFKEIEFHGSGQGIVRVFVDRLLVARYVVFDATTPDLVRTIKIPAGTHGYFMRLEMVGYFVMSFCEVAFEVLND